ncbi:Uncharacterised protein [Streptococcus pneumoniae]|nr:Uncharacterised protein [Streptococcus pneumoniae]
MTNLLFVSYSSKISSNRVNVALPYRWLLTLLVIHNLADFVSFIHNLNYVSSIYNLKTVADFVSSICNLSSALSILRLVS